MLPDDDIRAHLTRPPELFVNQSKRRGRTLRRRQQLLRGSSVLGAALTVALGASLLVGGGDTEQHLRTVRPAHPPSVEQRQVDNGGPLGAPGGSPASVGGSSSGTLHRGSSRRSPSGTISAGTRATGVGAGSAPRLAFTRATANSSDVWVAAADGSGLVNLTHSNPTGAGRQARLLNWSPDGKRIAFVGIFNENRDVDPTGITEFDLFVMNADGTSQREVTHAPAGTHGVASADWIDEHTLVVSQESPQRENDLWLIDTDSGATRDISNTPDANEVSPYLSYDRRRIAYGRISNSGPEVWTMNTDGSGRRLILANAYLEGWTPSGRLVIARLDSHGWDHLWVVNPDGSDLRRLTHEEYPQESRGATFFTDGRFIFAQDDDGFMSLPSPDVDVPSARGGPQPAQLMAANADGFGVHAITSPVGGQNDFDPRLSR